MAIELACACGAVFPLEAPPADGEATCPVCHAIVLVHPEDVPAAPADVAPAPARKPLWAVMGRAAEAAGPAVNPPAKTSPVSSPVASPLATPPVVSESNFPPASPSLKDTGPPALEPPTEQEAPRPARKGLWDVMQSAPPPRPEAAMPQPAVPVPNPPVPSRPSPVPPSPLPRVPPAPVEISELAAATAATAAPQQAADPALEELFRVTKADQFATTREQAAGSGPTNSRRALWALALGVSSIPLAFLALVGSIWFRLPAPLVGFVAIIAGLIASQEIHQSAGRQLGRKFAMYGIFTGIVGSFLGPVVLSGVGRWLVESSHTGVTTRHLETIGTALREYEKQRGSFPPGGVFRKNKAGDQRGYHGWMTTLLPWVGEDDLYAAIRQDLPYDDKANLPVFEQDVPMFFAAGTDRGKVRGKFGVSHFAGVGGEITDEQEGDKRVLHAGLFGVNSSVTRADVTDGLANTMAAGEIADDLPAWGDPENWRPIGRGLNRDRQGFGNHDRTGACFLMADGSVRFLSNKTSLKVLTALSTRDGGEQQAGP